MTVAMKILPTLLSVTTAAALVACSGGTTAATDANTLTLASVDQGSVEDVVKAFEEANPGVKVNFTTSGADQYQQQIRTQLSSGTAPDVMSVWPGNGNPATVHVLAEAGYLRDLSGQSWVAKYPKVVSDVAQYDGKSYNAIFGVNGIGAVYNEEAMAGAGLTPPGTWTELSCREGERDPGVRAGHPGQLGNPDRVVPAGRHDRLRRGPGLRQEDGGR